jgi:hypothetical protein
MEIDVLLKNYLEFQLYRYYDKNCHYRFESLYDFLRDIDNFVITSDGCYCLELRI